MATVSANEFFGSKEAQPKASSTQVPQITPISTTNVKPSIGSSINKAVDTASKGLISLGSTLAPTFKVLGQQLAAPYVDANQREVQSRQDLLFKKVQEAYANKNYSTAQKEELGKLLNEASPNLYDSSTETSPSFKRISGAGIQTLSNITYPYKATSGAITSLAISAGLKTGASALGKIGSGALGGYVFDVGYNLEEGKAPFIPGFGTVIGGTIPALGVAANVVGRAAAKVLPKVLPYTTDIGESAFNTFLDRQPQISARLGKATPETARDLAQESVRSFRTKLSQEWDIGVKQIIEENTGIRLSIPKDTQKDMITLAREYGLKKLPQNLSNVSANEMISLIKEFNELPKGLLTISPKGALVRSTKEELKSLAVNAFGGSDGTFARFYKNYAVRKGILDSADDVLRAWKTGKPKVQATVLSNLSNIFNESKRDYLNALLQLEKVTGRDIVSEIAAARLGKWMPVNKSISRGGLGINTITEFLVDFMLLPLSSPRSATNILNFMSRFGAPAISTPGDAFVRTALGKYVQDIKPGLVIKDVSGIPKELQPLAQEAKKYKSAEEFVKAQGTPVYHGTTKDFKEFSDKFRGSNTGAENTKIGHFFIEDKNEALQFAKENSDGGTAKVIEAYVNIKKPLDLTMNGMFSKKEQAQDLVEFMSGNRPKTPDEALNWLNENLGLGEMAEFDEIYTKDFAKFFKKKGYDGVISRFGNRGNGEIREIVAFNANQIKTKSQLTDLWNKVHGGTQPQAFEGFSDLSTKLLEKLKGRTTVSKQFISDLTNSPDLKQPERDLIRNLLEGEGKDVSVPDFANKVKSELLPLERSKNTVEYEGGRVENNNRYESVNLPDELRGPVAEYSEHIYNSPIKTSAGNVHFGSSGNAENYFAHTRIEDLPAGYEKAKYSKAYGEFTGVSDKQGTTRRVIELQSDLFQKGRLENEMPFILKDMKGGDANAMTKAKSVREAELAKLEPYKNTWHERIIREEVKQAAKDGKTKLQFPTGETAMKIEGLGEQNTFRNDSTGNVIRSASELKVGLPITDARASMEWIITDVLGDGKFKALPKQSFEEITAKGGKPELSTRAETFDISGKVDTENPIYKFYEKEVGKYLKNKYNAELVTDPQGVKWWEVKVTPEMKKLPIEAFAATALPALPAIVQTDKGNDITPVPKEWKSEIDKQYKAHPALQKYPGLLEAVLMQESSMGRNDANYNPDIGESAWLVGFTKKAKEELESKGIPVNLDTQAGVIKAMADYLDLKSTVVHEDGSTAVYKDPVRLYNQRYKTKAGINLKAEDLAKFRDYISFYQ